MLLKCEKNVSEIKEPFMNNLSCSIIVWKDKGAFPGPLIEQQWMKTLHHQGKKVTEHVISSNINEFWFCTFPL